MTAKAAERARELIKKAVELSAVTASHDEASATALQAARLIQKHGLLVTTTATGEQIRKIHEPSADWVSRWIESQYDGTCIDCGERYHEGERVFWTKSEGCRCEECAKD